jgi:hypothetical protein
MEGACAVTDGIRLLDGRRMQCKDIPNETVGEIVALLTSDGRTALTVHIQASLEVRLGPVPWNLLLAKLRKLVKSGRIDGCACGCRGEFSLPH